MQAADKRYTVVHNLDRAFDHFNAALFGGLLPPCVITLHRHPRFRGYFYPQAFQNRDDAAQTTHEIALNPDNFAGRTDEDILSTLAHEMCHLQQEVYGKPGRGNYHNRQWANMMLRIGLQPYSLADPSKMTGQSCSHTIIPGAAFSVACASFLEVEGPVIHWQSAAAPAADAGAKAKNKVKYTCPRCGCNVWGKPGLNLVCGDCDQEFESEQEDGDA